MPSNLKESVTCCLILLCALCNLGCSSRGTPAPVTELYQGKTFKDFARNGYKGNTYQVRAGDTLFSIAWYSGNDYRDLAAINNISAPYQIYPGQIISIQKIPKPIQGTSNKQTGQTSKVIINQGVDPAKKQGVW